MSTSLRSCTFGVVVLCILVCLPLAASATSVTVTGLGYAGATQDALGVSGGIFSTFSAAPDGPSQLSGGLVGVPMTFSFTASAFPGSCCTEVTIGNRSTDILTGSIIFTTGTFTVPESALLTGEFTTTVSVVGQVMAFQDLGGGVAGPLMAVLSFAGTGTVTLTLQDFGNGFFVIEFAKGTFSNISGTLTVVPEPSSLLLMSTGLAAFGTMAGRCRRRLRWASRHQTSR